LKNLSQSQPAETKALLTKLIAANPTNLKYQWQLAIVLYHCGGYDQAKIVNGKIIQQLKGSHQSLEIQGLAYSLEGKMKARVGRDQEALQDLTTAVSLFEKAKLSDLAFIDTLRDIAWLELRTGRRMQAAVLFERVNACSGEAAGAEPASPETKSIETFMMENIR
jgi:tetratricopeptide (TPR) repeat protein